MKTFQKLILMLILCLCLLLVINLVMMQWNVSYLRDNNVNHLGDNNVNHLGDNDKNEGKLKRNSYIKNVNLLAQERKKNGKNELSDEIREKKEIIEKQNNVAETFDTGIKKPRKDERIKREEYENNKLNNKLDKKNNAIKIIDDTANKDTNNDSNNDANDDVKGQKNQMEEDSERKKSNNNIIKKDHDNIEENPVNDQHNNNANKDVNDDGKGQKNQMGEESEGKKLNDDIIKKDHDNIEENPVNDQHNDDSNKEAADDVKGQKNQMEEESERKKSNDKIKKKDHDNIEENKDADNDGTVQKNQMEEKSERNELSDDIRKSHDNIKEKSINTQHNKGELIVDSRIKNAEDVTKEEKTVDSEIRVNDKTKMDATEDNSDGEFSSIKEPTNCTSPPHRFFPFCEIQRKHVKNIVSKSKTACYTDVNNVTNTQCSIYEYLAEVEQVCVGKKHLYKDFHSAKYATPNDDLNGLFKILSNPLFEWLRERISWSWPTWVKAVKTVFLTNRNKKLRYKQKNVFIYMGAPLLEPDFFNFAKKGGPVGELVQWADLIAANYILGHNITILMNNELDKYVKLTVKYKKEICASKDTNRIIDILYTDITGTIILERNLGSDGYSKIKCTFRVLDSFGTYPEFNFGHHPFRDKTIYGHRDLYMTQLLNLFPHTHDNSFLGFIVDNKWKMTTNRTAKENIALVYGKQCRYMKGQQRYLEIVSQYFKLHVTCVDDKDNHLSTVPFIAVNHGVVSSSRVQELLLKSKIFIGLGFPYEGPGPLEAMAAGCVFLQPRFNPPKNKLNTPFFQSKPTLRLLTSQNPYMEEVVGEPYCFTIDVHNSKELRATLAKIKAMPSLPGKIPKEYTSVGFLERVIVFNEKMDFCNPYAPRWPPLRNLIILYGTKGQSCKEACMAKGFFCEHTYFDEINSIKIIEKYSGQKCVSVKEGEFELHSPSYDSRLKTCFIKQGFLYSCMHTENDVNRVCPCRNYEFEQTAICKGCL